MKRVLITGAAGFLGQCLARRLGAPASGVEHIVLADRMAGPAAPRHTWREGDLADAAFIEAIAREACDTVFHLASMPGGQAERDPSRGRKVNLDATLDLFDALGRHGAAQTAPVVVFASSIAVYGSDMRAPVSVDSPTDPALSYGAHKRMGELALADASRRGALDGRSVRLPGIVARPRGPAGQASAFMSEVMHALAAGEAFTSPVSASATSWWMSARCAADNLIHAARMPASAQPAGRVWQLPALHLAMREVVEALAARFGPACLASVTYQPDPVLEQVFGRYPPLDDGAARAAGFSDDGTPGALIDNALAPHRACNAIPQGDNHAHPTTR